jgi:NAD(P)-dependent dehydrogenase (short-subunit alcohol dehydrogenase family)
MEEDDWDRCFLYNVKAHLWLMHAAKAELEKTEGAFITTASIAGVKPSGSSLPYAVTKAAAIHLSKSLAVICSPKIRVNSVSPGLLLTDWGMKVRSLLFSDDMALTRVQVPGREKGGRESSDQAKATGDCRGKSTYEFDTTSDKC